MLTVTWATYLLSWCFLVGWDPEDLVQITYSTMLIPVIQCTMMLLGPDFLKIWSSRWNLRHFFVYLLFPGFWSPVLFHLREGELREWFQALLPQPFFRLCGTRRMLCQPCVFSLSCCQCLSGLGWGSMTADAVRELSGMGCWLPQGVTGEPEPVWCQNFADGICKSSVDLGLSLCVHISC